MGIESQKATPLGELGKAGTVRSAQDPKFSDPSAGAYSVYDLEKLLLRVIQRR